VSRSRQVETGNDAASADEDKPEEEADSSSDEDDEVKAKAKQPVSVVDILAKRRVLLAESKIQVRIISIQ
jgi:hypothetical protein